MTIKTEHANQTDDNSRRAFAPIRRDLLERLARECESQAGAPWGQPMLIMTTPEKARRAG